MVSIRTRRTTGLLVAFALAAFSAFSSFWRNSEEPGRGPGTDVEELR